MRGQIHKYLEWEDPWFPHLGSLLPRCQSGLTGTVSGNTADRWSGMVLGSQLSPNHKSERDYPEICWQTFPLFESPPDGICYCAKHHTALPSPGIHEATARL